MYYLNSKPVSQKPSHFSPDQNYQWRGFKDQAEDAVKTICKTFDLVETETRKDQYFLHPGRTDVITSLSDDDKVVVRRLVDGESDLEQWETAVETTLPMKRSTAARIGRHLPRFNAPCVSAENGEELAESLSKKSKTYEVKSTRKLYAQGDVQAVIAKVKVDGEDKTTVSLTSTDKAALETMVEKLGLKAAANQNVDQFFLAV